MRSQNGPFFRYNVLQPRVNREFMADRSTSYFLRALYTIPGNTPMFWQKISRKVGSRTAQECQLKHQGHVLVANKKETLAKKTSAKEKNALALKGTIEEMICREGLGDTIFVAFSTYKLVLLSKGG